MKLSNRSPLILCVALLAVPSVAGYGGRVDCPPHPDHCTALVLELIDGTVVKGKATAEAEASASTAAQIGATVSARVVVTVTLTIQSAPTGNRSVQASVTMNETYGLQLASPATQSALVSQAGPSTLDFEFELDEDIPAGDILYAPVRIESEGRSVDGFVPILVGAQPDPPVLLWPFLAGVLGLGTGAGVTYYATRRP